jgi:hypothetical protein
MQNCNRSLGIGRPSLKSRAARLPPTSGALTIYFCFARTKRGGLRGTPRRACFRQSHWPSRSAARRIAHPFDRKIQCRRLSLDPLPGFVQRRTGLCRGGTSREPRMRVRRRTLTNKGPNKFAGAPWFDPSEEIAIEYHDKGILLMCDAEQYRCVAVLSRYQPTTFAPIDPDLPGIGPVPVRWPPPPVRPAETHSAVDLRARKDRIAVA